MLTKILRYIIGMILALVLLAVIVIVYDRYTIMEIAPPPKDPGWEAGPIAHLLPTVNDNRILVKVSFDVAFDKAPRLKANEKYFSGTQTDTRGYFWTFDVANLEPDTTYQLVIRDAAGNDLCDPWPLKTFPSPDSRPERLRLLIYTGLGGHDAHITWRGTGPLPLSARTRLLKKGLSLEPDAVVSSGDQIYYDLLYGRSPKYGGMSPESIRYAGKFDRSKSVLGTENEEVLKKAVGPQIANLYGALCRSVPTFFLLDDHDYFENDEARAENGFKLLDIYLGWRSPVVRAGVSFPPDDFMLELGRVSQKLYLPEFLPDRARPIDLPGSDAPDRAEGVSECYGTLRYGKLVEALLYESRRYTTLTGADAVMIHPTAEKWLIDRMAAEEASHVVNLPATIFGWSAGKWMEWYPDIRNDEGKLATDKSKYMWQEGWFAQHNRLLQAASNMKKSIPLFICGDIHDQAEGKILKSGDLDLSSNPVVAVASGSLGTGPRGFPSGFRGGIAEPPTDLIMEIGLPSVERNGFVIADFTPEKIKVSFYAWKPPEQLEAIDTMEPYHILELNLPE